MSVGGKIRWLQHFAFLPARSERRRAPGNHRPGLDLQVIGPIHRHDQRFGRRQAEALAQRGGPHQFVAEFVPHGNVGRPSPASSSKNTRTWKSFTPATGRWRRMRKTDSLLVGNGLLRRRSSRRVFTETVSTAAGLLVFAGMNSNASTQVGVVCGSASGAAGRRSDPRAERAWVGSGVPALPTSAMPAARSTRPKRRGTRGSSTQGYGTKAIAWADTRELARS